REASGCPAPGRLSRSTPWRPGRACARHPACLGARRGRARDPRARPEPGEGPATGSGCHRRRRPDADRAMRSPHAPRIALVLSGGGARGAYQVGVLRGLVEQGFLAQDRARVDILVGSSAGSINVAAVAARSDDLHTGITRLERIWREIRPAQVYRTDMASLGRIGARWAWDLSFGGATGHVQPKSLLDTAPLWELLAAHIPFERIAANVADRRVAALAIIATDLYTSNGVIFLDAATDTPLWTRRRWRIERTPIRVEHLVASSAIPIFFPSVAIGGRALARGSLRTPPPPRPPTTLGGDPRTPHAA